MEDEIKAICQQGPEALYNHVWNTHYVPLIQEEIADEASRRADAFAPNATFTVCDEELRVMTPQDLVFLDGMGSPFVAGGREAMFEDVDFFLWSLHRDNKKARPIRTAFLRGKFKARLSRFVAENSVDDAILQVFAYLDRVFIDLPPADTKAERKPPTVHCVAPLLVDVASILGPFDPMDGAKLGETPIPRLIQYQRAKSNSSGKQQFGQFDTRRSQCLEHTNRLMAEFGTLSQP